MKKKMNANKDDPRRKYCFEATPINTVKLIFFLAYLLKLENITYFGTKHSHFVQGYIEKMEQTGWLI